MEDQTVKQLREKANEISRIRKEIAKKHRITYGWSIAGNICSFLATVTGGGSSDKLDMLSSLFYFGKYVIWFFKIKPQSLQTKVVSLEDDIDRIFREAREIVELQVNAGTLTDGRSTLHLSVPFLLIWDILQRCIGSARTKTIDVKENSDRLCRHVTAIGNTIEQQMKEIEHLPPMLQKIKSAIEIIDKKTVEVVTAMPTVKIPENKPITTALLAREIGIKPRSAFDKPERHRKYSKVRAEIIEAYKLKRDFQKHALGVLKTARKCVQASNEAKSLPTYQLIQNQNKNAELLEEVQKSLKLIEDSGHELKQLKLKTQKGQHDAVTHVKTILNKATDAFEKLTEFDVDVQSKLESPYTSTCIKGTAKMVQKHAEKGCKVTKCVEDSIEYMSSANKAMDNVEEKTKVLLRSGIKPNRILMSEVNEEKWSSKSEKLAMSVAELAKHAKRIENFPEKIVTQSFKNKKTALVSQTTELAKESLEIFDQVFRFIEQENGNQNAPGQIRVLERVFHRVWSTCEQTTEIQTATVDMRSEARKLRLNVIGPDKFSNKLSTAFESVDKISLSVNVVAIIFDLFKLCTTRGRHPKEVCLWEVIERFCVNDQVAGRRNQN